MKKFILGAQCAGKTTIARHLRTITDIPVVEMDEQIPILNDGVWPEDNDYKETVLVPQVLCAVSAMPEVIFFENHMSAQMTIGLRQCGFHVVLLELERTKLLERNKRRIIEHDYDDASAYIDKELTNIRELQDRGLIDKVISADLPTAEIAQKILAA